MQTQQLKKYDAIQCDWSFGLLFNLLTKCSAAKCQLTLDPPIPGSPAGPDTPGPPGFPFEQQIVVTTTITEADSNVEQCMISFKKHTYRQPRWASSTIRSLMCESKNKTKIRIQNGLHLPVKPKWWWSVLYLSSKFSRSPLCSIFSRCSLSLQRKYIKLKTLTATQTAIRY